jgi:hypothetical protein
VNQRLVGKELTGWVFSPAVSLSYSRPKLLGKIGCIYNYTDTGDFPREELELFFLYKILAGEVSIFIMTAHFSRSAEIAVPVRLQTDPAGW